MPQLSWELPFHTGAAHEARQLVAATLGSHDADVSRVDTATLLVSELVSNSLIHGRGPLQLGIAEVADGWQVRVHDNTESLPTARPHSLVREGGRGMMLVDVLSRGWGTEILPTGGKDVWFTV